MTANELMCAVRDHKSVGWGPGLHSPAAVVANWQFWRVMNMLPSMVIYAPKKKARAK